MEIETIAKNLTNVLMNGTDFEIQCYLKNTFTDDQLVKLKNLVSGNFNG